MKEENKIRTSPRWGSTTKLIVALTFLTIIVLLITFYHSVVGPLLVAFIVSYLLHPVADFLCHKLRFSWGLAVNIIYLIFIILVLFVAISGGVFLINQLQSLIIFIQGAIKDLPAFLDSFSTQRYYIGPFLIDMSRLDLSSLINQLLGAAQNLIGQMGSVLGQAASSAAVMFGWGFFIIMISYFVLAESKGTNDFLANLNLPGYENDLRILEHQLARIWNAFLRGQIIVSTVNMVLYTIILASLGVHYFYVLAFVASIARIIPYLGAWLTWITFGLVAFFQGTTLFGMDPFSYAVMVVIFAILADTIMDNMITPKIMANSLKVHPAAVMVAAIIGISWIGIIGVILAAPVLATLKLFGNYALMKFFDKNPWNELERISNEQEGNKTGLMRMLWDKIVLFIKSIASSRNGKNDSN